MTADVTSTQLARDAAAIIRSLMREMGICDHILARENSYVRTEKVLSDLDALSSHPAQDEERVAIVARAIIDEYRKAYPGAGWPTLDTGKDFARAAISALGQHGQGEGAGESAVQCGEGEGLAADLERKLAAVGGATSSGEVTQAYAALALFLFRNLPEIRAALAATPAIPVPDDVVLELARLRDQLNEARMLSFKWMEAHDKLQAGEPYEFPKPSDVPDCRKQAFEEAAKVARQIGEQYVEPVQSDYDRRDGAYAVAAALSALADGEGKL